MNDVRNEDEDCAKMVSDRDGDVERRKGLAQEVQRKRTLAENRVGLDEAHPLLTSGEERALEGR